MCAFPEQITRERPGETSLTRVETRPSHAGATDRFDTIVRGGLVIDPERGTSLVADVGIRDGLIAAVGSGLRVDLTTTVLDAAGLLVTPGLIDLHAHVFRPRTDLGVDADRVGVDQAVTTLVDAGSTGALDFAEFRRDVIDRARTRVLSFLNISGRGLVVDHRELATLADLGTPATRELLGREAHRCIRGLKARMSSSVVGANGIAPLEIARRLADEYDLPIMVHVGNEPPAYTDVIDLLVAGDVVSHAFHGKSGGLFAGGAEVSRAARRARDRGVLFDVGHGSASFSFETLERALDQGFAPDTVSTDIHIGNVDGPVHSLLTTMSKLLAVGLPLLDVVRCATANAAAVIGERGAAGSLAAGSSADLSLLALDDGGSELTDSQGVSRTAPHVLRAVGALRAGVDQRAVAAQR